MECPICQETIYNNHMFSTICGHVFHGNCIKNCLSRKHECPTCRKAINESQIFQIYLEQEFFNCKVFESSINELKVMLQEQSAESREIALQSQAEIESLREEIKQLKENSNTHETQQNGSQEMIDLLKQLKQKDYMIHYLQEQNKKLNEIKADNGKQIESIRQQLDALKFSSQRSLVNQPTSLTFSNAGFVESSMEPARSGIAIARESSSFVDHSPPTREDEPIVARVGRVGYIHSARPI